MKTWIFDSGTAVHMKRRTKLMLSKRLREKMKTMMKKKVKRKRLMTMLSKKVRKRRKISSLMSKTRKTVRVRWWNLRLKAKTIKR
uniref:Uncharacterized protein n=1 Tax=Brassica campestris TaxID=3711 RepID=A0A3P5XYQ0_BRACM|nr:unnamed protein product [Brassica rapa]